MKPIIVPYRTPKPNQNQAAGLSYRMVAVKAEDVDRLQELKASTNQPITTLIRMAIQAFLQSAEPEKK